MGFDLFKNLKQTADQVGKFTADAGNNIGKFAADPVGNINKLAVDTANNIGKSVSSIVEATQDMGVKAAEPIIKALDHNGNGKVDLEDMIVLGMKVPGIRIDRAAFLKNEFRAKLPQGVIDQAIAKNPMQANIPSDLIDKIADEVINYERNCVSGISTLI